MEISRQDRPASGYRWVEIYHPACLRDEPHGRRDTIPFLWITEGSHQRALVRRRRIFAADKKDNGRCLSMAPQVNWRQGAFKRGILPPDAWFYCHIFDPVISGYRGTGWITALICPWDPARQLAFFVSRTDNRKWHFSKILCNFLLTLVTYSDIIIL